MIRVKIIQPLIPRYRVPLFRQLNATPGWKLTISASERLPWVTNLVSEQNGEPWEDLEHPARQWLPGTPFVWQQGMSLPQEFGHGDVLVLFSEIRYFSLYPLLLAARRRGVGTVWWGHGFGKRPGLSNWARMRLARLCDTVLLYSQPEVEAYAARGFRRDRLFTAQNAIDQQPIQAARAGWDAARLEEFQRRHGVAGRSILLYCGRLNDEDRLSLALHAIRELTHHDDRYLLVIIGGGECRNRLAQRAHALNVSDRVRFLGAIYEEESLAPWFLSADCFVFPRPIGLSLFHAFGYGLPVITHNCMTEHGPEIHALRDGENGLLFKDGDAGDLAAKILTVTRDRVRRTMMSAAALRLVSRDFCIETMANNFRQAVMRASELSLSA